ncbi:hypothetical protein I302_107548 [Kwoniella bestiolae CBS 10118]|uniref:AB hydrolase-1 domain-containing protein n=1 Tax=Kwoniella bestiolae CBS 10118 TaxID=1296100 RepID=A0A1B9FY79_9TREE|nr:hypothetical protein I302_06710 [Kwoniella bestiolae CBS 10118]OCF23727.1 hypothetical protein I302_06710 [Kwoniella bestiolae CBS 10118]
MDPHTPTALSDPPAYLALPKFNRRLKRCPRTNFRVTFSDIGDENGIPLLYLLPSGCSRWIAAPMDPLLKAYRVRMIVVDRPGCGGTSEVPLGERIDRSCEMIVSVLEYLNIRPTNILASSAGVYYALHLLTRHPSAFSTGLNPPPRLYLLAPWSPLLPSDHPDHWPFKWDWIPSPLIATQHITTPHLIRAATQAQKAYDSGMKAFNTSKSIALKWFKSITEDPTSPFSNTTPSTPTPDSYSSIPTPSSVRKTESNGDTGDIAQSASQLLNNIRGSNTAKPSVGDGTDIPNMDETTVKEDHEEGESSASTPRNRLWGECECCVACLTSSYMAAENGQGIGQEHLICLNRGPEETGSEWLKDTVKDLADTIEFAQLDDSPLTQYSNGGDEGGKGRKVPYPIEVDVWWGWLDDMVPRQGQLYFNKIVGAYPGTIDLKIHDVEDGDHTDL